MTVRFQSKEEIEKEMLEQEMEIHCTRATCMSVERLKKSQYQMKMREDGFVRCPKCMSKMI
jgi:hypothetical protein